MNQHLEKISGYGDKPKQRNTVFAQIEDDAVRRQDWHGRGNSANLRLQFPDFNPHVRISRIQKQQQWKPFDLIHLDHVPPIANVPTLDILTDPVLHSFIRNNGLYQIPNTKSNNDMMNMQANQCLLKNGSARSSKREHHSTLRKRNRSDDSGWYRKQYLLLSLPISTRYEFLLLASIDLES